jgi:hypothetical protein
MVLRRCYIRAPTGAQVISDCFELLIILWNPFLSVPNSDRYRYRYHMRNEVGDRLFPTYGNASDGTREVVWNQGGGIHGEAHTAENGTISG